MQACLGNGHWPNTFKLSLLQKHMLCLCRATTRLRNIRTLAVLSVNQGISPRYNAVQDLLKEHARLLRLVEKRVDERTKLQSEVFSSLSGDMCY